jgi:hypothetical protein
MVCTTCASRFVFAFFLFPKKNKPGVFFAKVDHGIDIAQFYRDNQENAEWVPLLFPGVKYTMDKVRALFFCSSFGRLTSTVGSRGANVRDKGSFLRNPAFA